LTPKRTLYTSSLDDRNKVQKIKKAAHVKEHAFGSLWALSLNETRLKAKRIHANADEGIGI
jgi:hypothetical protein